MVKFYWTDDLVPEQYKGQDIESMGVDMYALDGFYLEKGKKVAKVYALDNLYGISLFRIDAPFSGFIRLGEPLYKTGVHNVYSRGSVLFTMSSVEEMSSTDAEYQIVADPITGIKRINWTSLFSRMSKYNPGFLFFDVPLAVSFNVDNTAHLLMEVGDCDYSMRSNDTVSFLLDDGSILRYTIKSGTDSNSRLSLDIDLSESDLLKMCSVPISALQFESEPAEPMNLRLFYRGSIELGQILFQKFARRFYEALQEIGFIWETNVKQESISQIKSEILGDTYDYVVFDTETTGLPQSMDAPISKSSFWPHIVQISWIAVKDNIIRKTADHIIRPEGFLIPYESSRIHGITNAYASKYGDSLRDVLSEFSIDVQASKTVIGHNLEFDQRIICAELYRLQMSNPFKNKATICTMKSSVNYCAFRLKNSWKYRFPKLEELYFKLFGKQFKGAHNSMHDVEATYECYKELVSRGIIQ